LAQEQLQADYVKKIKEYEEKLAEAQDKVDKGNPLHSKLSRFVSHSFKIAEQDIAISTQIQDKQKSRIQVLSNQFDEQHALIDSIRLGLDHRRRPRRIRYVQKALSWVAYAFTLYHIILFSIGFIMYQRNIQQPHAVLVPTFLHDWEEYFYSHLNQLYF
jgi:hypothetical protein